MFTKIIIGIIIGFLFAIFREKINNFSTKNANYINIIFYIIVIAFIGSSFMFGGIFGLMAIAEIAGGYWVAGKFFSSNSDSDVYFKFGKENYILDEVAAARADEARIERTALRLEREFKANESAKENVKTSLMCMAPLPTHIQHSKDEWMRLYPGMSEITAQILVDNPPLKPTKSISHEFQG